MDKDQKSLMKHSDNFESFINDVTEDVKSKI